MVSKEIIESYLADYSAVEKMFREYHRTYQVCLGSKETAEDAMRQYQFFEKSADKFIQKRKDEEVKYPKEVLSLDNVHWDLYENLRTKEDFKKKWNKEEQSHFLHKDYFSTDKNIFINKHMRFSPGDFHDHEFIEMCYIYRGQVTHTFRQKKGAEEKQETLQQGNLVIIPPGMQHCLAIYDDSVMINIVVNKYTFEKTFLGDIPQKSLLYQFFSEILFFQESGTYIVFAGGQEDILREKLLDLMVAYLNDQVYGSKICDHYLSIFFLELLGQCENVKLSSSLGKEGEQIAKILIYIRNHYAGISLGEVAEEFHYSKTYLNRIFKKHMGTTILKYIQETRLEESALLLQNTGMAVDDIALRVGYEDTSYFIEIFKKKYKKTPLQYRHDYI